MTLANIHQNVHTLQRPRHNTVSYSRPHLRSPKRVRDCPLGAAIFGAAAAGLSPLLPRCVNLEPCPNLDLRLWFHCRPRHRPVRRRLRHSTITGKGQSKARTSFKYWQMAGIGYHVKWNELRHVAEVLIECIPRGTPMFSRIAQHFHHFWDCLKERGHD